MPHGIIVYIIITYMEARAVFQMHIHSPYIHNCLTTCRLKPHFSSQTHLGEGKPEEVLKWSSRTLERRSCPEV